MTPSRAAHNPEPIRETQVRKIKLAKSPEEIKGEPLPKTIDDGARVILQLFKAEEHVRIVTGEFGEDGKDRPKDMGTMLPASVWLDKLDAADGDPNKIFYTTGKQPGLFIGINPTVAKKGAEDKSITAYRHALLEFDTIPLEKQWELIKDSNIPCACVIASGGKSVHAWVRINATDRKEYDARVKILHDTFADYGIDSQNRNPARLSRLPNCVRGNKRQELLATSRGAESFSSWLAERELSKGSKSYKPTEFMTYVAKDDPDQLVGNNWLKRKGSMVIARQSGIGKSSLAMQGAVTWALGKSWFGMKPIKKLKQLIFQAENDFGDLAEQFQGVFDGLGFDDFSDELQEVNENLTVIADATRIGKNFVDELQRHIDINKPDVVWIDPLLSFIGDDISRQEVCGRFLREWLTPVKDSGEGTAIIFMHHTNKPPQDSKARAGWSALDYAYMGTGSSELVNWARAGAYIEQDKSGLFRLLLTKRGERAGATDIQGDLTTELWLQRSQVGINWLQCQPPISLQKDEPPSPKSPKPTKWDVVIEPLELIKDDESISEKELWRRFEEAGGPGHSSYYSSTNKKKRKAFTDKFIFNIGSKKFSK